MSITVRPAVPADAEHLARGNVAMALEAEHKRLDPVIATAGVRALFAGADRGRYFVAERAGRFVGQLMITYEWSDWRNRPVWWIQSVHVASDARRLGVFRALYAHARAEAVAARAGGLRLYVDETNTRAQAVYTALGMNGGHYRVFEDMFDEPPKA